MSERTEFSTTVFTCLGFEEESEFDPYVEAEPYYFGEFPCLLRVYVK